MDEDPFRLYRGPGWFGVIVTSFFTSSAVVFGVLWGIQSGHIPGLVQSAPPPAASAAPALAQAPANVKVPTILGLPADTANELLGARGLRPVVRERRESPQPAGIVIAQNPLADSLMPRDGAVELTLSSGPPANVAVPELTGKLLPDAIKELEAAGLKAGAVNGPDTGDRIVLASKPAPGASVSPESTVELTVELRGVEVPKLVGLSFRRRRSCSRNPAWPWGRCASASTKTVTPS
ncbi:MAG: PASTA domain-containing protein [Myxococcales bacterium]